MLPIKRQYRFQDGNSLVPSQVESEIGNIVNQWNKNRSGINALEYGAVADGVTDNSSAVQAAVNAAHGKPIIFPAGTYVFKTTILIDSNGFGLTDGMKIVGQGKYVTIFDNQTGGPLFKLTNSADINSFQDNALFSDFEITSTSNTGTSGIWFTGVRQSKIQNLLIQNQANHGIYFESTAGDSADVSNIHIFNCELISNGGYGVFGNASGSGEFDQIYIYNSRCNGNSGGILFYTLLNSEIKGCSVAGNSSSGIVISASGGSYSKNNIVSQNEIDTNGGANVGFQYAENCLAERNYFIANSNGVVGWSFYLSDCLNITLRENLPRYPAGITGIIVYYLTASASYTKIYDTDWSAYSLTGNTKYSDAGDLTTIYDNSYDFKPPRLKWTTVDPMANNYRPDNTLSNAFRIFVSSPTTLTLGAPIQADNGAEIILMIENATSGAITLSFNAVYLLSTWVDPGAFKTKSGRFIYDSSSAVWKQVGAWSTDM